MKKLFNKNNKGFCTTDYTLVIGLIAVAALVAFFAYPKVKANANSEREIKNIVEIINLIENKYKNEKDYSKIGKDGYEINRLIKINHPLIVDGTTVVNNYGGEIKIIYDDILSIKNKNNFYRIQYDGVPSLDCFYLVKKLNKYSDKLSLNGFETNNVVKEYKKNILSDDIIRKQCSNKNNTVYFWNEKQLTIL